MYYYSKDEIVQLVRYGAPWHDPAYNALRAGSKERYYKVVHHNRVTNLLYCRLCDVLGRTKGSWSYRLSAQDVDTLNPLAFKMESWL